LSFSHALRHVFFCSSFPHFSLSVIEEIDDLKVTASTLGLGIAYPEWGCRAFPQLFQWNSEIVHSLGHYRFLLNPFHSSFINTPNIWQYNSIPSICNRFFPSPKCPSCFWDPPRLPFSGDKDLFRRGVKRPVPEAERSPPSITENKNKWIYTCATPRAFKTYTGTTPYIPRHWQHCKITHKNSRSVLFHLFLDLCLWLS
jgi:hypothetical protein